MSAETDTLPFVLLSIDRVMAATDFGRTKIEEMTDPDSPRYDPTFPKPRRVGARTLRYRSDELSAWMASLPVAGTAPKTVVSNRGI